MDELKALYEEGIQYTISGDDAEPVIVKVHTLLSSVDAVARAPIQNITQFNRKHGCSYCLLEGERIPVKKGFTRVYCGDEGVRCSNRRHAIDVEQAVYEASKALFLVLFPHCRQITCTMHCWALQKCLLMHGSIPSITQNCGIYV